MPNLLNSFGRSNACVDNSGYVILNLSGAQKFEEDIIFSRGKYKVEIQAGASINSDDSRPPHPYSGKIDVIVNIPSNFKIRAYCGSKASDMRTAGTNLYSGPFKVNGNTNYGSNVPSVNHIFGNAGSCAKWSGFGLNFVLPSSGNCLGNGAVTSYVGEEAFGATGAGSCLHFLPIGGTFGTDYLFAAHCTAAGAGATYDEPNNLYGMGGSGSAYGGAGSGSSLPIAVPSYNGGNTPYGSGGAGVNSGGTKFKNGNNGTGIGHGFGGGVFAKNSYTPGAAAYFDGTQWIESNLVAGALEDGKIKVTYLGLPE